MQETKELGIVPKGKKALNKNSINIQLTIEGMPDMEKVKTIQKALKGLDKIDRVAFEGFREAHHLELMDLDLATIRYFGEPCFDNYKSRMRLYLSGSKHQDNVFLILYSQVIEIMV